jgi:hypothetical protein
MQISCSARQKIISLRRHYPYQVKGFGSRRLSQKISTPDFYAVFMGLL